MLQPTDCAPATPVKKKFLKISGRATFRIISMNVIEFSTEL